MQDNVITRRRTLAGFIAEGAVDQRVLEVVLPNGVPLPDEDYFWDFKITLPILAANPNEEQKKQYASKMAHICKDAVAFYNMYGGYLVIGVEDKTKTCAGFSEEFDANDLCKKIEGYTRTVIDAKYRRVDYGSHGTFGLLYIPKRNNRIEPAQFVKVAAKDEYGQHAFAANDIYMRSREECRKATSSADISLLFNREKQGLGTGTLEVPKLLNNLPNRDPSLVEFIGRESQIDLLWTWMIDRYHAVKLLSGPGGVGKTTIANAFCESVAENAPAGLEKIIWLTAKKRTYAAVVGKYVEIAHTRFHDVESLLVALLEELGAPDDLFGEDISREELIEHSIEYLKEFPSLLVVDDVDSLEKEGQFDLFQTVSMIFDRVIAAGASRARSILTARLTLGASPGQLMTVTGLPLEDFEHYVLTVAKAINAPFHSENSAKQKEQIRKLHEASEGSPLFASAILRLISLGEPLNKAIKQFKGEQGVEVRRFAFERELEQLTDSQLRVLFAAINLTTSTISDIVEATQSNRTAVQDDIGVLRDYHLMSVRSQDKGFAKSEGRISVSNEIRSMADLIRSKLTDPSRIEKNCAKINKHSESSDKVVADFIREVTSFWRDNDFQNALEAAQFAVKKAAPNGDFYCLLGRCYLQVTPPDAKSADVALRRAKELDCVRPELLNLRIDAKVLLEDWIGIVEILADREANLSANDSLELAHAYSKLGDLEVRARSYSSAENHYLHGGQVIKRAFDEGRAHGAVEALKELKHDLMLQYFDCVMARVEGDNDKIDCWDALLKARSMSVYNKGITIKAMKALVDWAKAINRRGAFNANTFSKLETTVNQLKKLEKGLSSAGPNWDYVAQLAQTSARTLSSELEKYKMTEA